MRAPASGGATGVVVFGWAVRAAAAILLALYTLGLTGVTRSPPSAGYLPARRRVGCRVQP